MTSDIGCGRYIGVSRRTGPVERVIFNILYPTVFLIVCYMHNYKRGLDRLIGLKVESSEHHLHLCTGEPENAVSEGLSLSCGHLPLRFHSPG